MTDKLLAEVPGPVLLAAGLAEWRQVSDALSTMIVGATVANPTTHYNRPFRVIEDIGWPFLLPFFLLAGAAPHADALRQAGALAAADIGLRVAGRLLGTRAGGYLSGADVTTRRWIGLALLPQAGVAIGMAPLASQHFPDLRGLLLPVVLGSTVIFELLGPVATRGVLAHPGDIGRRTDAAEPA